MKRLLADGDLFHQMFDDSPAFFALLRGDGYVFELANKAYMALLPGRELIGRPARDVVPEVVSQGYFELLDQVRASGEIFKGHDMPIILHDPDGRDREVFVDFVYQPIKDDAGKVIGIFVQGSDVTERKLAENRLRESEEKYRLLFQSIDQGYCVIKVRDEPGKPLDYQFIEVNDSFAEQSGLWHAEGKWVRELRPHLEEFWFKTYRDVAVTGQPVRFEHESKELNRWFSAYAFRIGKPEEMLVALLFSDITQRIRDQQALKEAHAELELKVMERTAELAQSNHELAEAKMIAERASQAKSDILSNTSHELRTPLNSLLLISQLLAENPEKNLTDKQRKYAEVIVESAQDLLTLVNDLLDMAQIESGVSLTVEPGQVNWQHLHDALMNGYSEIARKKQLDFQITMSPELPERFVTDERRLLQILKNLLTNAFKFTSKGAVTLEIAVVPADVVQASLLGEALTAIQFSVTDTGIGISEEKQQIIFEAFRQADAGNARQYGGTGLGLTISLSLAEMLGGTIQVESRLGEGSVFKLILPSEPFMVFTQPPQSRQHLLS
ncbi:MAG TPA: ATP-binding protein [Methylophilaceae bacterium]|nr:ATP-binding protein [Methylophilaceae bacterium]